MVRTRILLDGNDVELLDDVSIPLNYAIADIREPEKKNTNFSKTITLPGTDNNHKLFGHLWDTNVSVNSTGTVNYTPEFNPNLKADCLIIFDGDEIFKGFMQLNKINVTDKYKIDYEVTVFGKLKDLFYEIQEKYLSDLDFSEYNHSYTEFVQKSSWNSHITKNGINFPFTLGDGYVYPMIDYGFNNDVDYKVEHFFPAFYLKTIVDKIINGAGFQYDSSFFNSTYYKSLVIPYGNGSLQLSNSQILNRTFRSSNNSTVNAFSSGTVNAQTIAFNDDTTSPNHDAGGNYNISTFKFIAPKNGLYKFNLNLVASLTHFPSSSPVGISGNVHGLAYGCIKRTTTSGTQQIIGAFTILAVMNSTFNSVGNVLNILSANIVNSGDTTASNSGLLSCAANILQGETVEAEIRGIFNQNSLYSGQPSVVGGGTAFTRINILTGSYFEGILQDTSIHEGDTITGSNILPKNIKQKDFLSSILKIFNLYIEQDNSASNKLLIEPRPDFYTAGSNIDWSNKLDYSRPIEILPMGALDNRTYLFRMKEDGDYYNQFYKNKFNEIYGQERININNDFINQEKLNEVVFSPTPLVDRIGSDRIISRIWQLGSNGQVTPKTSNLRLLFYGGVKITTTPYNYISSSGTSSYTTYGYAGHLDDTNFPSHDINFGVPNEVYYTANSYTNNNLFNRFYKQFINEISDKDSKIIIAYFHLNSYDISILNFRNNFFFEQDYYRLNRIYDYNPIENRPTKCEFIKLKNSPAFTGTSGTVNGAVKQTLGSTDTISPTYAERRSEYDNIGGSGSISRGERNIIDSNARGVIVSGNDNFVGQCENVTLISSSGCVVPSDINNVTLINCTNLIVDSRYEGYTVIDNSIYGFQRLLFKTANYKGLSSDIGKLIIFNISSNSTYDLPENYNIANGWKVEVKNNNSGAFLLTVNIVDSGVFFEDGTSITEIIPQGESLVFTYRSNVWYATQKHLNGANYIKKIAAYTAKKTDDTIDCTANTFTITLPTAVGITGKILNIKNSGTGIITLDGNGAETIDGSLTATIFTTQSLNIQSTGTGWIVI